MGSVIGYPEAHGAVATFETDVAEKIKSLIVDVEPVQDLHGYDSPWPAGGGKNLLDQNDTKYLAKDASFYGVSDDRALAQINTLPAGTYTLSFTEKVVSLNEIEPVGTRFGLYLRATSGEQMFNVNAQTELIIPTVGQIITKSVTFTLTDEYVGKFQYFYVYTGKNVSGPIPNEYTANIYDVQLERGSTATAYEPYSNICPITGWTGAKVMHGGKNLAQYWKQAYIGSDGTIKSGSSYALTKPIFVQAGKPVSISNTAGDYQGIAVFSDESLDNMIYRLANTASTYIAEQDCYIVFWFNKVYSEYTELDFVDRGVQIEFNYSPTNYEPYSHDEYDIEFPSEAGVVYGGKVNAISGELVVDKTIVDLGTLDWSKSNLTYFKSDSLKSVIEVPVGQKTPADIVCSEYATLSYSQVNTGNKNGIAVIGDTSANGKGLLTINDLALVDSTAADFKASLSGIMLVYKMSTPITYSLTPQEINTIIGTNTIYSDTGDVSVLYPKTLTPAETVSNVNLMELRRSIIAAQGNDNLYNKWIWKQEKNDFVIRNNTVGFIEGLGNNIYTDQHSDRENNRRSIVVKRGMVPFVSYDSVSGGTYAPVKMYPIPIPPDAINVQMSCNQQNLTMGGMFLRLVNGKYELMKKNTNALKLSRPLWTITGNNHFFAPYIFTGTLENVRITFSRNGQWRWTLTNNDLSFWSRSVSWDSTNLRITCSSSDVNNYKTIIVSDGLCGYYNYMAGALACSSPVPVPPTATKVTVTTTPALQAQMILLKAADDQTQQLITNNGWNATPAVMTFTADDNLELAVALRVNSSAAVFTTSTTPTEIIIQFE